MIDEIAKTQLISLKCINDFRNKENKLGIEHIIKKTTATTCICRGILSFKYLVKKMIHNIVTSKKLNVLYFFIDVFSSIKNNSYLRFYYVCQFFDNCTLYVIKNV